MNQKQKSKNSELRVVCVLCGFMQCALVLSLFLIIISVKSAVEFYFNLGRHW